MLRQGAQDPLMNLHSSNLKSKRDRAFTVVGPKLWYISSAVCIETLKARIKEYLKKIAFTRSGSFLCILVPFEVVFLIVLLVLSEVLWFWSSLFLVFICFTLLVISLTYLFLWLCLFIYFSLHLILTLLSVSVDYFYSFLSKCNLYLWSILVYLHSLSTLKTFESTVFSFLFF